jgi:hypothetical protein
MPTIQSFGIIHFQPSYIFLHSEIAMLGLLPTELLEHIADLAVLLACQSSPPHNQVDQAVQELQIIHPLTLINRRYNIIFTPCLYRTIVLQTPNSRDSFIQYTAPNQELCNLVRTLIYSERMNGSRFHNISSKSSDLETVLLTLPRLTTLKIWKVVCWKKWETSQNGDHVDLTSLTNLRTLELLEPQVIHGLVNLHSILPQIERLVMSGVELRPHESGARNILPLLTNLKSVRIHSTRFTFEMWTGAMIEKLGTDKLEEIVLDSTIPFTVYLGPEPFMKVGTIDRWRDSLRVFRFRGDPLESGLKKYLETVLEKVDVVDIREIPVKRGEDNNLRLYMWMG